MPLRPGPALAYAIAAVLLVALVFVQAVLAGQALYGGSAIAVHGYVGNASFAVGAVAVALAFIGRVPPGLLLASFVLSLLLFVQTGLGYLGRDMTAAAAWHVPLGVSIFGLAVWQAAAAVGVHQRERDSSANPRMPSRS